MSRQKNKMSAWEITLIALGSPIWVSLLVCAIAVIISLYACILSAVFSCWAVFASVCVCSPVLIIMGIIYSFNGNALSGIAIISAGIFSVGLSIFLFYFCKAFSKAILKLANKMFIGIKRCFVKKEVA